MWLRKLATWDEIEDMSLDDVDLHNLMLDALDAAREREHVRRKGAS